VKVFLSFDGILLLLLRFVDGLVTFLDRRFDRLLPALLYLLLSLLALSFRELDRLLPLRGGLLVGCDLVLRLTKR